MTTRSSGSGAGPNWKVAQPPKRRSVQAVVVVCLLVVTILIFVAIAALLFNRPLVLTVIAACALTSLGALLIRQPLRRVIRVVRRHRWRTLATVVLCGLSFLFALALFSSVGSAPAPFAEVVSVPYAANMSVNGKTAILNEQITIDKQARQEAHMKGDFVPAKWSRGPVIDGEPTFRRQQVLHVRLPVLGAATLEIPIDLAEISVGENPPVSLVPRDASTFKVIAKKGAIAATYPATTGKVDLLRDHLEETVIGIAFDNSVRLAVLSPVFQNQTGVMAYQVIAWGPLPWVTGLVMIVVVGALWRRLTDLLDQVLKRIVPQRKQESRTA